MSKSVIHDLPTAITLRSLTPADFEAVHVLLSDWTVVQYMMLPHCKTQLESRKYLEDLMTDSPGGAWQSVVRAIETHDSGDVIGLCVSAGIKQQQFRRFCSRGK